MLTRLRDVAAREDGFTLAELLTVMVIGLVIGGFTITGLASGVRAGVRIQNRVDALGELRTAADRMARSLRAADPVEAGTASATAIQVRVQRNGVCTRFAYALTGANLVQTTQGPLTPAPAAVGSPTVPGSCTAPVATVPPPAGLPQTTLVRGVPAGTTVVFTYFNAAGAPLNFAAVPRPLEREISTIVFVLRRTLPEGAPIEVTTTVHVRNSDAVRS